MKLTTKLLSSLFLTFFGTTSLFVLDKKPSDAQSSGSFINNSLSGKCIDVAGAPGRGNGAVLQLWDCELSGTNPDNNSTTDQQWSLTD